jgi:hypothetical protein
MLKLWGTPLLALCALSAATGCSRSDVTRRPEVEVKAGIFFGGQLQRRMKWPFVLDPAHQTQGFRLQFRKPLPQAAHIAWEISRPRLDGKRRLGMVTSKFDATIPAGTSQNDQLIALDESDRPGKWKLRVSFQDRQVFSDTIEVIPFAPNPNDD